MGEQSVLLKRSGNSNGEQENNENDAENMSEDEIEELNEITSEEFAKLDNQLDELNSALDDIEQKNDDIHAKLLELLHANREIRQELQNSNTSDIADQNTPN